MKLSDYFSKAFTCLTVIVLLALGFCGFGYAGLIDSEFYDFNDNQVPSGWTLTTSNNGGIHDGKMQAHPTDGGATLSKELPIGHNYNQINVEYDSQLTGYSYWSIQTKIYVYFSNGEYLLVRDKYSAYQYGDDQSVETYFSIDENSLTSYLFGSPDYEEHHHTISFSDGKVTFKSVNNNTSSVLYDRQFEDERIVVSEITKIEFKVGAHTGSDAWMDNLSVEYYGGLDAGLIAHWKFDGDATDSSGNGNNGSENGDPAYVDGVCGQAISLDGVDDYIRVQNDSTINFDNEDFSISLWFKANNNNAGTYLICKNRGPTDQKWYGTLMEPNGTMKFVIDDGINNIHPTTPQPYNDEIWHFLVGVRDKTDNRIKLYIDGQPSDSITDNAGSVENVEDLLIGKRTDGDRFFNGLIDDVRIYNRPLSQSEVQTLMNECDPGVCVTESHDLNDHQAPEGWEFYSSGAYFQDGKLWADPVAHGGGFAKDMTGISGATSMKFEMDGLVRYSSSGTRVSAQVYYADGSGYRFKNGVEAGDYGNNNVMTIDVLPGNNDAYAELYPREDGEFHFVVELEDGLAKLYAKRISDGQQVAYLEQELPGLLLDEIVEVRFHVMATTINAIWIDNPDFKYCVDVIDSDGDGYSPPEDCDDNDASANPGAVEACYDSVDNDCDGLTDWDDLDDCNPDQDGDGWWSGVDCDDNDASVNPGVIEMCDDGVDNDCNGLIDCKDSGCDSACYSAGIIPLCGKIGQSHEAFFPDENWVLKTVDLTVFGGRGDDCKGRCGYGCPGDVPDDLIPEAEILDCGEKHRYTQACLNHDACIGYFNELVPEIPYLGFLAPQCFKAFLKAFDDCLSAPICFDDDDADLIPDNYNDNPCTCGETQNCYDNCIGISNPDQYDGDCDGIGVICDLCPFDPDNDIDNDGVCGDVDNCPTVANGNQNNWDNDGLGDACDDDIDGDGVLNDIDECEFTPIGEVVDPSTGCAVEQLVPCEGPRGTTESWKNHGKYMSTLAHTTNSFVEQGLITEAEKEDLMEAGASSDCGKK